MPHPPSDNSYGCIYGSSYAFVTYSGTLGATTALNEYNGKLLDGRRLQISFITTESFDHLNSDHVLLGEVLGFDSKGQCLWDDSDFCPNDPVPIYSDVHGRGINLEYLMFLRSERLAYYGEDGAPHDFAPHDSDAYAQFMAPFYGPRDLWHSIFEAPDASEASISEETDQSEHEAPNAAALLPRSWAAVARDATKGPAPTAPAA